MTLLKVLFFLFLSSTHLLAVEKLELNSMAPKRVRTTKSKEYVFRAAVGDTIVISPKDNPEKRIHFRKKQSNQALGLTLERYTGKSAVFTDRSGKQVLVEYAQMDEGGAGKASAKNRFKEPPSYSGGYDDEDFEEFDEDYDPVAGTQDYEPAPPPPGGNWDRRGSSMTGPAYGQVGDRAAPEPLSDDEIDSLLLGDEGMQPPSNSQIAPLRDGSVPVVPSEKGTPGMNRRGSAIEKLSPQSQKRLDDPYNKK